MIPPFMTPMQPVGNPAMRGAFPQGAPPLYIGNLDETVYEEQLFSHFSKYGPIRFLRIAKDSATGKSKGYGYINFMEAKDAENARMLSQYEKIGKNPVRLMYKRNVREGSDANLFIKNIDRQVTIKELHNLFNKVGKVLSAKIGQDTNGNSLGYGYVQMEKKEDADRAIEAFNGQKLKEHELSVEHFKPKNQRDIKNNNNLYIKGLPAHDNKDDLEKTIRENFGKFGTINSILARQHEPTKKWFAFVSFENPEDATRAVDTLSGTTLPNADEPLYVAYHQSRHIRDAELKKKHLNTRNTTNLFVKNLKPDVTGETLKNAFSHFGEVTSAAVKTTEVKPGDQRAFGFVNFKVPTDASKAQTEGHRRPEIKELFLDGQDPFIGFHQSRAIRMQFKNSRNRNFFRRPFGGNPFMANGMFPMPMDNMRFPYGFPMPMMHPQGYRQRAFPYNHGPRNFQGGNRGRTAPHRPHGNYNAGNFGGQYNRDNRTGNFGGQYNRDNRTGYRQQHQGPQGQAQQKPDNRRYQGQQQVAQPTQQPQREAAKDRTQQPQTLDVQANLTVGNLKAKLDDFLKLEPEKQRNILGELLYPKIYAQAGAEHAPKITGMLVDFEVLSVQDILEMLEDDATLRERIQEAMELIKQEGEQ